MTLSRTIYSTLHNFMTLRNGSPNEISQLSRNSGFGIVLIKKVIQFGLLFLFSMAISTPVTTIYFKIRKIKS
jgi:hypothetical protein